MKSIVCVVLLALCCGKVSTSSNSSEAESEFANGNDEPTLGAHQPNANSTSHSGRIVNGSPTLIESFTFIVRLRVNNIGRCGANIITWTHALTAAHCLYDVNDPAMVTLYGGSTSQTRGGVLFYASKITLHPNYSLATLSYDAAIIQVKNRFGGSSNVAPIALQNTEVPAGTFCNAVGWGVTSKFGPTPDSLYSAVLKVLTMPDCYTYYGLGIPSHVMCAFLETIDVCNGDSGGPLVCNGKLAGITSYNDGTCQGKKPAVFTKVSNQSIRDFIRSVALI